MWHSAPLLSSLYFSGDFVFATRDLFGLQQIYILIFNEDLHFETDYNVKQNQEKEAFSAARV